MGDFRSLKIDGRNSHGTQRGDVVSYSMICWQAADHCWFALSAKSNDVLYAANQ
jgi:hypothetical protein